MEYWIIGYGKVGRRALKRLLSRSPEARFTVVDPHLQNPPEGLEGIRWKAEEGVSFLRRKRVSGDGEGSTWIIPALPRHLVYEWLAATLPESHFFRPIPVPEAVASQLPNAMRGAEGQIFMSIADFVCPVSCSEPQKGCPVTGKPRPFNLYAHLGTIREGSWQTVVVRSYQLAPGVGGYRTRQLIEALEAIRGRPGSYLVSTASKCHGVMHAFETEG
jgi:hypothetical protein